MIPNDYTLKAGNYREIETGRVFYFCNCSSQPHNRTLRFLANNRQAYEVYPPEVNK